MTLRPRPRSEMTTYSTIPCWRVFYWTVLCCAIVCWSVPGAAQSRRETKVPATKPEALPTGMSITPLAAPGSTFQPLNPDLPDLPQFTADHPVSTALSPDGGTLLILTSGYNTHSDARGKPIPAQSNEYVFVYDVRQQPPVKRQVLQVPFTFAGIAWNPSGHQFYVSGGVTDRVHIFEQAGDRWAEQTPPI